MSAKNNKSMKKKAWMIALLLPITITVYVLLIISWNSLQKVPIIQRLTFEIKDSTMQVEIPEEYLEIYMAAEEEFGVPWTLLAAHHRIETKFSSMSTLVSPVGAEGHMQFMPCTFVGWSHPSCSDLGKGDIPEEDKVNPEVIEMYGGYGIDANGDGVADPFDIEDAIFSAANYLAASGAADGDIEKAVFNYNRSEKYVEDVMYYYELYSSQHEERQEVTKRN
jgi:membrane-bound lytic murein transglycosylase B